MAYDTTVLSTAPKRVIDNWKTMLPQHMSVSGQDVRDYIITWLNDGFTIIGSNEEYKPTHIKEKTEERIQKRIQELINSF